MERAVLSEDDDAAAVVVREEQVSVVVGGDPGREGHVVLHRCAQRLENVRPLPERAGELELLDAIREEMVLSQPLLALCRTDCKGLCPQCGTNLNESSCQCSTEEDDPRWDTLRALKKERD